MSDMARIFSTDPLKLTKDDISLVVKEMRESLHLFNANPSAAKAKPKTSKAAEAGVKLSLDDLGI